MLLPRQKSHFVANAMRCLGVLLLLASAAGIRAPFLLTDRQHENTRGACDDCEARMDQPARFPLGLCGRTKRRRAAINCMRSRPAALR